MFLACERNQVVGGEGGGVLGEGGERGGGRVRHVPCFVLERRQYLPLSEDFVTAEKHHAACYRLIYIYNYRYISVFNAQSTAKVISGRQ